MNKEQKYQEVYKQIESVVDGEPDQIANMANTAALLHEAFGFWWTGFYIVKDGVLVLGPFQGPVACTRIGFGKGVCGTSWERKETIVVPMFHGDDVYAVLDIDSKDFSTFDSTDQFWLEKIVRLLKS